MDGGRTLVLPENNLIAGYKSAGGHNSFLMSGGVITLLLLQICRKKAATKGLLAINFSILPYIIQEKAFLHSANDRHFYPQSSSLHKLFLALYIVVEACQRFTNIRVVLYALAKFNATVRSPECKCIFAVMPNILFHSLL